MKHFLSDPDEHKASHAAAVAWQALKKAEARKLAQWEAIGRGFLAGRNWAKRQAGILPDASLPAVGNMAKPIDHRLGRLYNEKFGQWLREYKLDDIDQAARTNLFKLMDNPAVLAWRNGLPGLKRDKLNHPTTILRAYDTAHKKYEALPDEEPQKTAKQSALEAAGDAYQALRKENVELRIQATKRCDVDLLHSDVEAIIAWLKLRAMDAYKAKRIRDALLEMYPK